MAPPQFLNFDPTDIVFTWNAILIRGYAADTFLTAEQTEDTFTYTAGIGGGTRVKSIDFQGTITITLMAGSVTNRALNTKYRLDRDTMLGFGPALVKHVGIGGDSLVTCVDSWIMKPPPMEFSTGDPGTREWVFGCAEIDIQHGAYVVAV